MYRGKKQHVMLRKLFVCCKWSYGGRNDQGPDYVLSGSVGLLFIRQWLDIEDFKLEDNNQNFQSECKVTLDETLKVGNIIKIKVAYENCPNQINSRKDNEEGTDLKLT